MQVAGILGGLLLLTGTLTQAQNYCTNPPATAGKGDFTVNAARSCAPFTVTVIPGAGITSDQYTYQYNGSGLPLNGVASRSFTYTQPGTYTILQGASKAANGAVACQVIEVLATPPIPFTVQVCAGRKVTVTLQLDSQTRQYDVVTINWGDGKLDPISPATSGTTVTRSYTYTNSGQFSIEVRGAYSGLTCQGQLSTQTVTLAAGGALTAPVVSQLTTRSNSSLSLTYQATGIATLWQKTNGTYQPTSLSGTSGEFTINTDATRVQCFQVVAEDGCGNRQSSDEVCSLVLNAQAQSLQNNLNWVPYAGTGAFRQYRLSRNGTVLTPTNATSRNTGSYSDNAGIACGGQYCYTLSADAGPTVITSAPVCVTGINQQQPGPFRLVYPSVEAAQQVLVQTILPAVGTTSQYTIQLLRADSPAGPFRAVGQLQNTNLFSDTDVNPSAQSYCYQAIYTNACGLSSVPSAPACTVWLTSKTPTGIDWTADSPFTPGSIRLYGLEILDTEFNTTRYIDLGGITHYEPDLTDPRLQVQRFRIIAFAATGQQSKSNYYELRQDPRLFIPTAFTPNGDTANDTFQIRGTFLDTFEINVYSRWGEVVYSSKDPAPGWDGTYNGTPLPAGHYTYRISVIDVSGQLIVKTGTILLLR